MASKTTRTIRPTFFATHQSPQVPRQVGSDSSRLLQVNRARFVLDRPITVMTSDLDQATADLVDDLTELVRTADVAFGRGGFAVCDQRGGAFEGFETAWASIRK